MPCPPFPVKSMSFYWWKDALILRLTWKGRKRNSPRHKRNWASWRNRWGLRDTRIKLTRISRKRMMRDQGIWLLRWRPWMRLLHPWRSWLFNRLYYRKSYRVGCFDTHVRDIFSCFNLLVSGYHQTTISPIFHKGIQYNKSLPFPRLLWHRPRLSISNSRTMTPLHLVHIWSIDERIGSRIVTV